MYLTTHEGIAQDPQPAWWNGITPDTDGRTGNGTGCAIIMVDHGGGSVDAFYFYFYAYVLSQMASIDDTEQTFETDTAP